LLGAWGLLEGLLAGTTGGALRLLELAGKAAGWRSSFFIIA